MKSRVRLVNFKRNDTETEAKVSIYDSALMFGDMVFEMTRSFNKAIQIRGPCLGYMLGLKSYAYL